jgi:hypothetical protein
MPRYLVERLWNVGPEQMPNLGRRSLQIAEEQFPDINWEHSHVVVDGEGNVKTYCVYEAQDEDAVRGHANAVGSHVIDHIYEIAGDAKPEDFPSDENVTTG